MREAKAKELNIVLVGRFSPSIITPHWLAGKGLINDLEAKDAVGTSQYISHLEISQFRLPYCDMQVLPERYLVSSTQEEYFDKLCELTIGIFTILRETPILQLGINTIYHYDFGNAEAWHAFGHLLAPKELWRTVTKNPGLKRIDIISQREDGRVGEINTIVSVSEIFPFGIKIQVNDHFGLYTNDELSAGKNIGAGNGLEILSDWNGRLDNATKIIGGVINHEQQ